jgi:hypothetical protein
MLQNPLRFLGKLGLLWFALGLLFAIIGANAGHLFKYRKLVAGGSSALGKVTGLEPSNHRFVDYSFHANGRPFAAKGSAGFGNPEFEHLSVGQAVTVTHLPNDPSISCLGDPRLLLRNEEQTILGMIILFPTFVLVVFSVKYPSIRAWLMK